MYLYQLLTLILFSLYCFQLIFHCFYNYYCIFVDNNNRIRLNKMMTEKEKILQQLCSGKGRKSYAKNRNFSGQRVTAVNELFKKYGTED